MTNNLTRRALLLGGAAAMAGCTQGLEVADAPKDDPVGGIGGTGIVGTLTDFGSLMVNGRRVLTDEGTVVRDVFGRVSESALAVGQALSIEARSDTLAAARVLIADPLTGPVTSTGDRFEVMGVPVALDPAIGAAPEVGARVAVSGLWRGDMVVATRLAAPSQSRLSAVAGVVDGETIGGVPVRRGAELTRPPRGAFVIAVGLWVDGALSIRDLDIGRFTGAAGPLDALSVEGYLDPIPRAPFFELAGLGHSFDRQAPLEPYAEGRAIFEGPYSGTFDVAAATRLPDGFEARRTALRTGGLAAEKIR